MTDKTEPKVLGGEDKRIKRKQSLEAAVTLGLGYGKKKKHHVEAFYSAVWPILQGAGWTLVNGEGREEGAVFFLPPGVKMGKKSEDQEEAPELQTASSRASEEGPWDCTSCGHTNVSEKSRCTGSIVRGGQIGKQIKCMAWRGGKRVKRAHFTKIRDILDRVLFEEKNEAEAQAAAAYLESIPDAHDMFTEKKDRASEDKKSEISYSPSRPIRQNIIDHSAWKDERTHFEKASSRVGSEFQVNVLPAAGSYYTPTNTSDAFDGGDICERVWDPEKAEKYGKLDFVHTRVKFTKKEAAYDIFHSRDYRLPGFYQEVSTLSPTDCFDWTKEDKDRFRAAVFEHHENMKKISTAIGKSISECITHYLVTFKRTKSYKSLKRSMRRKANVSEGNSGVLVCNECGKGGMLIACDTCEAHYHLSCTSPPLASIPDGNWLCSNCKRETRSMLSSPYEMSCGTDQQPTEGLVDDLMEGLGEAAAKGPPGDVANDGTVASSVGKPDSEDAMVEGSGDNQKRKLSSEVAVLEGPEDDPKSKIGPEDIDAKVSGNTHSHKLGSENITAAGASGDSETDTQAETESSSEQPNVRSSHKRMRMNGDSESKDSAVLA